MSYVFFCEFEELHSPVRTPELQGGGVHGNAILSRFPLADATVVPHRYDDDHMGFCNTHTLSIAFKTYS